MSNEKFQTIFDDQWNIDERILLDDKIEKTISTYNSEILELFINNKCFLINKNKKTVPWLELGIDKICGKQYINWTNYMHIQKDWIDYRINKNWEHYPWLDKWFERISNWDIIKNLKNNKYNILKNWEFLLEEWFDGHNRISWSIDIDIFVYKDYKIFAINDEFNNRNIIECKFDSVNLFWNTIRTQKNKNWGHEVESNVYIIAKKDWKSYIYNEKWINITKNDGIDERTLWKITAIDLAEHNWRWEIITSKENKYYLYKRNGNRTKLLSKETGADSISPIQDRYWRNKYRLIKDWNKFDIINDEWSSIMQNKEWFDKLHWIEHIRIPDDRDPDFWNNIIYAHIQKTNKSYLIDINNGHYTNTQDISKILTNWFDTIEQLFPKDTYSKNKIFWYSPIVIKNWEDLFIFDEHWISIPWIYNSRIGEIQNTDNENDKILRIWKKHYIMNKFNDIKIDENISFDEYLWHTEEWNITVSKLWETYILNTNNQTLTKYEKDPKTAINKNIIEEFFNEDKKNEPPF